MNQPYYTTEHEVSAALANGTFGLHHNNCMKAYEEAREWQKYLKDLAKPKWFPRKKAKPCLTSRNFTFFQFTCKPQK